MEKHFNTRCLHGNGTQGKGEHTGAISFPIYQTATFAHPAVGQSTGYDYSRVQNPTREQLEHVITSLEKGFDTVAFSSGMAALQVCMELFVPGDHIIASDDMYGGSLRLFEHINSKNGIEFSFVDTSNIDSVLRHRKENTKAIYIETPTNPMMQVTDLNAISQICNDNHLLFIVDNTFLSPYFQNPIQFGADIVLHSGTKFLGGHNDTLAGFLITARQDLSEQIRFITKTIGSVLSPFDSWLLLRGIKTLSLRMERQQENALRIVDWLEKHPKVKEVFYVGLPSHPGYEINLMQARGFGSMLSFRVDCRQTAIQLLERVRIIQYAESLGGVESLITYPMLQTHADVAEEKRKEKGITETLLRFSVGIEYIEDLLSDLEQAFNI